MLEYDFTLILRGVWDDLTDEMVGGFLAAGCDDGSPLWVDGRISVAFGREAETAEAAVFSAIADVRKAGYEVERIEEGDAVSRADMAARLGCTRQHVGALTKGRTGPGDFPAPISPDGPRWSWREVSAWLAEHDLAPRHLADLAAVVAIVNAALDYKAAERDAPKTLRAAVAAIG